ncbi:MAG: hypothetical protein M1834_000953 [Cirrosporium novae-zelandiae]|nr:MAG: hypothetical protein M1834_000953 [Cirrosporium novae-zelandiae]
MPSLFRQDIDGVHLMQKIILLHLLNNTPDKPSERSLNHPSKEDGKLTRTLSPRREKELAQALTFLASSTDDPKKVLALCLEEGNDGKHLIVRMAANHGDLEHVQNRFRNMATILERVAMSQELTDIDRIAFLNQVITLNRNRILIRLRSNHAILKCNFKKMKKMRPKLVPKLSMLVNGIATTPETGAFHTKVMTLKVEMGKLEALFSELEAMNIRDVQSDTGLKILVDIINICKLSNDSHVLDQVLEMSSNLDPSPRKHLATTVSKLSCYATTSEFLLQAAKRLTIFLKVEISVIKFTAPGLPLKELHPFAESIITKIWNCPNLKKKHSSFKSNSQEAEIAEDICTRASLAYPIHAEIQLLFHYELNASNILPRVICSSKMACFLCNLFFRLHGKFIIPSSHGRLYEKWALPKDLERFQNSSGHISSILHRFNAVIEEKLLCQLQSDSKPYPQPYESAIFASTIWSLSNRSHNTIVSSEHGSAPIVHTTQDVETKNAIPNNAESDTAKEASPSPPSTIEPESPPTPRSVFLKRGDQICTKLSTPEESFEVITERIHLTLSYDGSMHDDKPPHHDTHPPNHNQAPASPQPYCITFRYLHHNEQPADTVSSAPIVNLEDLSADIESIMKLPTTTWPKKLYIHRKTHFLSLEYRPLATSR